MVMRVENGRKIEGLGRHSAESISRLQQLLAGGARVIPDPKRPDFYEVESGAEVYYIYVSPVTGTILLLATWGNDAIATTRSVHQAA